VASVTIVSGAIPVFDTDHLDRELGSGSPLDRKFWVNMIRRVPRIHASPIHSTKQEVVE
jgi:hypothetical protein